MQRNLRELDLQGPYGQAKQGLVFYDKPKRWGGGAAGANVGRRNYGLHVLPKGNGTYNRYGASAGGSEDEETDEDAWAEEDFESATCSCGDMSGCCSECEILSEDGDTDSRDRACNQRGIEDARPAKRPRSFSGGGTWEPEADAGGAGAGTTRPNAEALQERAGDEKRTVPSMRDG